MASRRALLQHVWAMLQTRGEAAGLVLGLQQEAWRRSLAWYGVAAVAALALVQTLVLLVALGTPAAYRTIALVVLAAVLLAAAVACLTNARRQWARDAALVADFRAGLKLDFALVNLALRDPASTDEDDRRARERAGAALRQAVAEKAAAPGTVDGRQPEPDGSALATADAAVRATTPVATEIEPTAATTVVPPEALLQPATDKEERNRASA